VWFLEGDTFPAICSTLIGILLIPAISNPIEKKLNVSISAPLRFIILFCLFIGFGGTGSTVEYTADESLEQIAEASPHLKASISGYHDNQWLDAVEINAPPVAEDMYETSNAADTSDYDSLSDYAEELYYDSQVALNESSMYGVSPELQPTKDEYEWAMSYANEAGNQIMLGVEDLDASGEETYGYRKHMNLAIKKIDECKNHTKNADRLLKEYQSNL
jgi:hypothetical protein